MIKKILPISNIYQFEFFGHWHHTMHHKYGNTTFMCLGELAYIDVDLSDSESIHESIYG